MMVLKVTASGGISKLDDLRAIKELAEIGVDSAILGKSLYARAFTLQEALEGSKEYLATAYSATFA